MKTPTCLAKLLRTFTSSKTATTRHVTMLFRPTPKVIKTRWPNITGITLTHHAPPVIYQHIDLNGAQEPTASKDNLGYIGEPTGDPYYYSLERTPRENIYDKVTEELQEHVYNVLEEPN